MSKGGKSSSKYHEESRRGGSKTKNAMQVLCEKKVSFLGQWWSTGFDESAYQVWRNQVTISTQGTKAKLRITDQGISFEGTKLFSRKDEFIHLVDIKDFFLDDHYLDVVVAIVRVTATKHRILVFRCANELDCRELVNAYRSLVDGLRLSAQGHSEHWQSRQDRNYLAVPEIRHAGQHHGDWQAANNVEHRERGGGGGGGYSSSSYSREETFSSAHHDNIHDKHEVQRNDAGYARVKKHDKYDRERELKRISELDDEANEVIDHFDRVVDRHSYRAETPEPPVSPTRKATAISQVMQAEQSEKRKSGGAHVDMDYEIRESRKVREENRELRSEIDHLKDEVELLKLATLKRDVRDGSKSDGEVRSAHVSESTVTKSTHSEHKSNSGRRSRDRRKGFARDSTSSRSSSRSRSSSDERRRHHRETASAYSDRTYERKENGGHKLLVTHHADSNFDSRLDTRPPAPLPVGVGGGVHVAVGGGSGTSGTSGQAFSKSVHTKTVTSSSTGGAVNGFGAGGSRESSRNAGLKLVSSSGGPTYDCDGNLISADQASSSHYGTTSTSGYGTTGSTYNTSGRSMRVVSSSGETYDKQGRLISSGGAILERGGGGSSSTMERSSSSTLRKDVDYRDWHDASPSDNDPHANHLIHSTSGSTMRRGGGSTMYREEHRGPYEYRYAERHYSEAPSRIEVHHGTPVVPVHAPVHMASSASDRGGYRITEYIDEPERGRYTKVVKTKNTVVKPIDKVYVQRSPPPTTSRVVYYGDGTRSHSYDGHVGPTSPIYVTTPDSYDGTYRTMSSSRSHHGQKHMRY